ncbi:hypothetical protein F5B22DRAFT_569791 [Xylaria bambusicola]|uniref:uncharacterized protein n=1 Tax=Xylaria bambusicola TaxID=326684 RepID=UPI0020078F15|nr:uncharacterized protein F5B22DRAFT_569791 [Xylaria bambusicola]KAI0521338.1 hypothetical protein F5B22DRAFT_569791 [Xylaria bambusicola]
MAPTKRPGGQSKAPAKSSKRPRLTASETATKTTKKKPAKISYPVAANKLPGQPVYSPNVDTSDVDEEHYKPRVLKKRGAAARLDGKKKGADNDDGFLSAMRALPVRRTARELRAGRRHAEQQDELFTDEVPGTKAPRVAAGGGDGDGDPTLDAEGEDEEPVTSAKADDIQGFLREINSGLVGDARSDSVARNPFASGAVDGGDESSNKTRIITDAAPVTMPRSFQPVHGVQFGAAARYLESMKSKGLSTGDHPVTTPSPFQPAHGAHLGTAARYLEFMKNQGQPQYTPPSPSSSSSSSSSSSEEEDDNDNDNINEILPSAASAQQVWTFEVPGLYDYSDLLNPHHDDDLGAVDEQLPGDDNNGQKGVVAEEEKQEQENEGWLVYPHSNVIDSYLSTHLRTIATTLNFMARAAAAGIRIDDYDALAAAGPEQWSRLAPSPECAAEVIAGRLLNMSVSDICVLSLHARALQEELAHLGVEIE